MSENSSLRDFSAQVTQIVFLAYLIALQAYYTYMSCNLIKLVSPRFEFTYITNLFFAYSNVLRLVTTVLPEMSENSS